MEVEKDVLAQDKKLVNVLKLSNKDEKIGTAADREKSLRAEPAYFVTDV